MQVSNIRQLYALKRLLEVFTEARIKSSIVGYEQVALLHVRRGLGHVGIYPK